MALTPKHKKILIVSAKILGGIVLVLALLIGILGAAFFLVPEIRIPTSTARSLIQRFAPESVQIKFDDFDLSLSRVDGKILLKRIVLSTKGFCVQYEKTAVDACIEDFHLALTAGFSTEKVPGESRLIPHIIAIEPLKIIGADIAVDLTAFPPDPEPKNEGGFDFISFLRKEILPKWDIEGSRVEVREFFIRLSPESSYAAVFDFQPGEVANTLEAVLHDVWSLEGPLRVTAKVLIQRPASWGNDQTDKNVHASAWKVIAGGLIRLDGTKRGGREVKIQADSNITGFNQLDFRIQTFFKGISAIKEVRLEGDLKQAAFKGILSAKLGASGSELQALDFVNCGLNANLDEKVGGIRCGPQSVRLQIRERSLMHRPDLFIFAPEFDLKISNVSFDETKSADYTFALLSDHLGMARLAVQLGGSVSSAENEALKYSVKGRADLVAPEFLRITDLLRTTTFAIPAPLNTLNGAVALKVTVDMNQSGGGIDYIASTRLDSTYQSMHLDINGRTAFVEQTYESKKNLVPETEMTLSILRLAISAPRFDLRTPPAFKSDSRFGKINEEAMLNKVVKKALRPSSKFKLTVKTATPEAIRIATNLTKAAVPISVDVVYDSGAKTPSPVSGWVQLGQTPIELFKRNAQLENLKIDLLPSGDNRLNGRVTVRYIEYAITILLLGQAADPQVRFSSDPALDDDQIISVLLFGRTRELADEDQSSVANTKAAITDAVLGLSSLYLLASTPIESVGYDPESGRVTARVGIGGGASLEFGAGNQNTGSGVGLRKRISREFVFRSDVETLGTTGERTVSALIEWVRRF